MQTLATDFPGWDCMTDAPLRVLVVEDDPDDLEIIRELFATPPAGTPEEPAVFVLHADRIRTALEVDPGQVDCVVLDLTLPDGHGLDSLSRILGHFLCVPVVVLTGHDEEGLGLRAVRAGAHDYLEKAILFLDTLPRAVRYAIERFRRIRTGGGRDEELLADQLRFALSSAEVGFAIVDRAGHIRHANPAAELLTGGSHMLERTVEFRDLLHDHRIDRVTSVAVRRADRDDVRIELRAARTRWEGKPAFLVMLHEEATRAHAGADPSTRQIRAVPAAAAPSPRSRPDPERGLVLVADDNAVVRRVTCDQLRRLGFEVAEAASGIEAVDRLREDPARVRAVLMDLVLADRSGLDGARDLWRIRPDLPVILTSRDDESAWKQRYADEGFASYLCKTSGLGALESTLRRVLLAKYGAPVA